MAPVWKLAFVLLAAYFVVVSIGSRALADQGSDSGEGRFHQELLLIQADTISANLEGVPLGEILEQIKMQANICYRGNEPLLEQKVSVRFKYLPVEDGVKRILAPFNYSLVFDDNGGLAGVILLGKSQAHPDVARQTTVPSGRSSPAQRLDTARTFSSPQHPGAKPLVRSIIGVFHPLENRTVKPPLPRSIQGSLSPSSPDGGKPSIALGVSHHMTDRMRAY